MKKSLLALLAVALCQSTVAAQGGLRPGITPSTRPPFSPYLNLNRFGNSPGFNYYGMVRPELAFRDSLQTIQGDVAANRQMIEAGGPGGQLSTGHTSRYLNTGGFFLNMQGGMSAAGAGAGRGGAGATGTGSGRTGRMGGGGGTGTGSAPKKPARGGR